MRRQIARDGVEARLPAAGRRARISAVDPDRGGQAACNGGDLARAQGEPVVRLRTGQPRHALERVETVHPPGVLGTAARRECPRMRDAGRSAEEVGVERHDHVRPVEVIDGVERASKGQARARAGVVRADRIPLMPAGLGEAREHALDSGSQGRRRDRLGEEPESGAAMRPLAGERLTHRAQEGRPRTNLAEVRQRLGASGIVEIEDRRLREDVGGAQARRMERVPLDLGRPAFVALDEHAHAAAGARHRGGVEQRPPRHDLLGLTHVRNDQFGRLPGARRRAGERQRGAHQLEELPAGDRIGRRRVERRGELVVQQRLERRVVPGFIERAPEAVSCRRRHRWHVEQLVRR